MKKEKLKITKSSGNVFVDSDSRREEAAILAMRSELMCRLEILIRDKQWTQSRSRTSARHFAITRLRPDTRQV